MVNSKERKPKWSKAKKRQHKLIADTSLPTLGYVDTTSHSRPTTAQQAQAIHSARKTTKTVYDDAKAQGISTSRIMDHVMQNQQQGPARHAAKMLVVHERSIERTREFKVLFPEIAGVPDVLKAAGQKRLLMAAGWKGPERNREIAKRKAALGISTKDDDEEDEGGVSIKDEDKVGVAVKKEDELGIAIKEDQVGIAIKKENGIGIAIKKENNEDEDGGVMVPQPDSLRWA